MQVSNLNSTGPLGSLTERRPVEIPQNFSSLLSDNQATSPNSQVEARNLTSNNAASAEPDSLRKAFQDFVGQTFFAEMIKSYRSTQQEAAYFNGGRAEKIFQGQLDQTLAEELSQRSADKIADPMFELFQARRS